MARNGGDKNRSERLSSADAAPDCDGALVLFPVVRRGRAAAADYWHRVGVADGTDGLVRSPVHYSGSDAAYADAGDRLFVHGSRHQPDRNLQAGSGEWGIGSRESRRSPPLPTPHSPLPN